MINRLQLLLPQDEFSALVTVALKELRTPAAQARHMLRLELASRKVLKLTEKELVEELQKSASQDEPSC